MGLEHPIDSMATHSHGTRSAIKLKTKELPERALPRESHAGQVDTMTLR